MKRTLRIAALIMLVIAVLSVVAVVVCMDFSISIPIPLSALKPICHLYLDIMIVLFVLSFIVRDSRQ